jgi:hypothetical protein
MVYDNVDWIQLVQDRVAWQALVNTVNEPPLGVIKGG